MLGWTIPEPLHSLGIPRVRRQTSSFATIGALATHVKMAEGRFQEVRRAHLGISLFKHADPLRSNRGACGLLRASGELLFIDIDA